MLVEFRTLSNKSYKEELDPKINIAEVKTMLSTKYGFEVDKIRLLFRGKTLSDENTIQETGIDDTSFIVILTSKAAPVAKRATPAPAPVPVPDPEPLKETPTEETVATKLATPVLGTEALPTFHIEEAKYDPPDFEQRLAGLLEMGFHRGDCEEALRAASYDPELAATYVLEGVPIMPRLGSIVQARADSEEEDEEFEDVTERVQAAIEKLRQGEVDYDDLVRYLQTYFPVHAYVLKNNPIGFFSDLGYDPTEFQRFFERRGRETVYERLMSEFSDQEKLIIHRLEEKGFDTMTVIQVFNACERNETATLECLKSIGQ